jgi:hypothetical protein
VTRGVVRRAWLIALAVLLAATPALAQPRRGGGRGGGGAGSGDAVADRRERIKKRIRALRAYTLTDELALDEDTAARLFPILSKYDDEIGKRLTARTKLQKELEAATDKGDDKATDKAIDDLVANQKALWEIDEKRFAELRKVLTPAQSAKLLVVLPALERKVQRMLQRAINGRAAGRAGRGRADDLMDDDDDLEDADDVGPDLRGNPYPR